jgi:hypothetical protein
MGDCVPAKRKVTSRISTMTTDEVESMVIGPSQQRLL